jgi:hypothetical protein
VGEGDSVRLARVAARFSLEGLQARLSLATAWVTALALVAENTFLELASSGG